MVHLPEFGKKKNFPRKSGSVTHNFIWVSSTMPLKKLMIQFQENTNRRKNGRMDRPYFIGNKAKDFLVGHLAKYKEVGADAKHSGWKW